MARLLFIFLSRGNVLADKRIDRRGRREGEDCDLLVQGFSGKTFHFKDSIERNVTLINLDDWLQFVLKGDAKFKVTCCKGDVCVVWQACCLFEVTFVPVILLLSLSQHSKRVFFSSFWKEKYFELV